MLPYGLKQRKPANIVIHHDATTYTSDARVSSAVQTEFTALGQSPTLPSATNTPESPTKLKAIALFFSLRRVLFFAGVLAGIWITLTFVSIVPTPSIPLEISTLFDTDVGSLALARDFISNFTSSYTPFYTDRDKEPPLEDFIIGKTLHNEEGTTAHYPVVMLPGVVSTGLESWTTPPMKTMDGGVKIECNTNYFRKRVWGTMNMVQMLLLNKQCWLLMMRLDPETGLDDGKTGSKVRASQGLDSVDFLFPGYWVWNKVINNLAAIGYDNSQLHTASYDWRLSFKNMEIRDKFFSRLQRSIESIVKNDGRKAIVISHSMGSLIWLYFMNWVESPLGGNGGEYWVDDHIAAFVNIAGSLLGVPKTISSLLSGETRETALLNGFSTFVLERLLSKTERRDLFRNMGALPCMLPKGGNRVWGTEGEAAPDDNAYPFASPASSSMLTIRGAGNVHWAGAHNTSFAVTQEDIERSKKDSATWDNPLLSRLPTTRKGSNFSIYCIYGVGKLGERSYFYSTEKATGPGGIPVAFARAKGEENEEGEEAPVDFQGISHSLNVTFHDPYNNVEHGVRLGAGDGTVPLISLGYPCLAWRDNPLLNPSNIRVVTREYPDQPDPTIGGRVLRVC
ncbi:hypothetical protein SeLEV6574_g07438 [Synchytrium endobioticum]|uniref:Phospholipid:diacylglycerol acyltransferase n=1 Tax=Synchytrium endobioticum TaxID=286115 RepID=A0A507CHQ6_9FUNG|nr:hypothetical protein SeLEV6574_g07438 [Synchytrium endobioticum]